VISLARRDGRPLRIGHRGAPVFAPENTIESFRAAIEAGVDLVEFDVTVSADGRLVVAHGPEDVAERTPTLDEVLRFFADEAQEVGVHLDLKLTKRERDVVDALRRHGLVERSFVSSYFVGTARAVAAADPGVRTGFTMPRRLFRITEEGRSAGLARVGLRLLRWTTPFTLRPVLAFTRASDLVLHHSAVTRGSVRAAHARGAAVVAWTVDDPAELARLDHAGVDAVVSNDPRIFASATVSTLPA
jgi:glycerophosphoryl diester phosphodiesterase